VIEIVTFFFETGIEIVTGVKCVGPDNSVRLATNVLRPIGVSAVEARRPIELLIRRRGGVRERNRRPPARVRAADAVVARRRGAPALRRARVVGVPLTVSDLHATGPTARS
jgi:hypothetical protein